MLAFNNRDRNRVQSKDLPIHGWYQFVLGYPPHLVRYYIEKFGLSQKDVILDPFAGTGTTLVEASMSNLVSWGVEANPITYFASKIKTYRNYNINTLENYLGYIFDSIKLSYKYHGIFEGTLDPFTLQTSLTPITVTKIDKISAEQERMIPRGFISPRPLSKVLIIREIIEKIEDINVRDFFKLALATFIVKDAGNISFGPEIGKTKSKEDVDSLYKFMTIASSMISDLQKTKLVAESTPYFGDARNLSAVLPRYLLRKVKYPAHRAGHLKTILAAREIFLVHDGT